MDAKYKKLLWISIGLSLGIMLLVILFTFDEETVVALTCRDIGRKGNSLPIT